METKSDTPTQQTAGALVYWRKGARYVPSIMSLDSNTILSLTAADRSQVFSAPLAQLGIRFTAWGTLLVEADGVTHAIKSSGGLAASSIPAWQSEAARHIGTAGIFARNMRQWQDVFIRAGVPLKRRSMRAMSVYIWTLIAIAVAAALLAGHR